MNYAIQVLNEKLQELMQYKSDLEKEPLSADGQVNMRTTIRRIKELEEGIRRLS